MPFVDAIREKIKLRMAVDGPSGSGKSLTLMRLAIALAKREAAKRGVPFDPMKQIAVIDSEHGAARKYVGDEWDGEPIRFRVCELASFSPTHYTAEIEAAAKAGFFVLIIDSLSHAWEGKDGVLEIVDKSTEKNRFSAWKDASPMHRRMVDTLLAVPLHILVSMRSKTEYILQDEEKDGRTVKVPKKIGVAPVQRQGMEYEFDIYGSLDWSNVMQITKSRCTAINGSTWVKPGAEFAVPVIEWLEKGNESGPSMWVPTTATSEQVAAILAKLQAAGLTLAKAKDDTFKRYAASEFADLTIEQANEYVKRLDVTIRQKAEKEQKDAREKAAAGAGAATAAGPPASATPSPATKTPAAQASQSAAPVKTPSAAAPAAAPATTSPTATATPAAPASPPNAGDARIVAYLHEHESAETAKIHELLKLDSTTAAVALLRLEKAGIINIHRPSRGPAKVYLKAATTPAAATPAAAPTANGTPSAPGTSSAPGTLNRHQLAEFRAIADQFFGMKELLGTSAKDELWKKILAKRGVERDDLLTHAQAKEIATNIAAELRKAGKEPIYDPALTGASKNPF